MLVYTKPGYSVKENESKSELNEVANDDEQKSSHYAIAFQKEFAFGE